MIEFKGVLNSWLILADLPDAIDGGLMISVKQTYPPCPLDEQFTIRAPIPRLIEIMLLQRTSRRHHRLFFGEIVNEVTRAFRFHSNSPGQIPVVRYLFDKSKRFAAFTCRLCIKQLISFVGLVEGEFVGKERTNPISDVTSVYIYQSWFRRSAKAEYTPHSPPAHTSYYKSSVASHYFQALPAVEGGRWTRRR